MAAEPYDGELAPIADEVVTRHSASSPARSS
jgi:hypothetical protein